MHNELKKSNKIVNANQPWTLDTFDYYDQLSSTKKWWSKTNSNDYIAVISDLKELNHLLSYEDVSQSGRLNYYKILWEEKLKEKCEKYLDSHSGYKWTRVGKKRYKLISELSKLLDGAINRKKIGQMRILNSIPYFVNNEENEEYLQTQNRVFANSHIYGEGGFLDYIRQKISDTAFIYQNEILDDTYDDGWAEYSKEEKEHGKNEELRKNLYEKSDHAVIDRIKNRIDEVNEKNKNANMDIHIGNRFFISGLSIARMFTTRHAKGFHMDEDERKNLEHMEAIFNNLLAGDKVYDDKNAKSQDIKSDDELDENEKRHLEGMRQYKEVMYKHYEYIYKKYGKYLYQLHPADILSRSDNFRQDIIIAQDMDQYFDLKHNNFKDCKIDFEDNLRQNPILKFIFPEEDRERDLFFVKLAVYYNDFFMRLEAFSSTPGKYDTDLKEIFARDFVDANVALEKDIERDAQKYGLGEMKGLSEPEKQVYFLNLHRRGLDKEFDIGDRLLSIGKERTLLDYYNSLNETKDLKGDDGYESYKGLLAKSKELINLIESKKDELNDYKRLREECDNYLVNNKRCYMKTTVTVERYNLIYGLRNLINRDFYDLRVMDNNISNKIPYFVTDNKESSKNKIIERNNAFKKSRTSLLGENGVYEKLSKDLILQKDTEDIKSSEIGDIEKYVHDKTISNANGEQSYKFHIGNKFIISDGLLVSRALAAYTAKGFHMDKDEKKNINNMKIIFKNLLEGNDYDKNKVESPNIESIDKLNDIEKKNLEGILQYKEVIRNQYKYIYQKYGKYLYQLHPLDALARMDNFESDSIFAQDVIQYFGMESITNDDFESCKAEFENALKNKPILKLIFPEEKREEDLFLLRLAVYYNYLFTNLKLMLTNGLANNGKYSIDEVFVGCFNKEEVNKLIELEKPIEDSAKKYGLGKMKGLSGLDKRKYLDSLWLRGLEKDFNLDDRLRTPPIKANNITISDYYNSLNETKDLKDNDEGYEYYRMLLRELQALTLLLEDEKDERDYISKHNIELCIKSLQDNCDSYLSKNKECCRKTATIFERYELIQGLRELLN